MSIESPGQAIINEIAGGVRSAFPKLKVPALTIPYCSKDGEGYLQIHSGVEGSGASVLTLMQENVPHINKIEFWHQEIDYRKRRGNAGQHAFRYVETIRLLSDQSLDYSVTHHIPYNGSIIGNVQARGFLEQANMMTHSFERTAHDPEKPKVLFDSHDFITLMGAMITHKRGEPYFADSVQLALRPDVK
jgi:hypothetical protein